MKTLFLVALACLSYSVRAQNNDPQDTTQAQKTTTFQKPTTIRLDGALKTNPPLYILDGKEITDKEMEKLSPDHIASISILKDAKSLEVYGEKGKNGVVIIERKKSRFKLE